MYGIENKLGLTTLTNQPNMHAKLTRPTPRVSSCNMSRMMQLHSGLSTVVQNIHAAAIFIALFYNELSIELS